MTMSTPADPSTPPVFVPSGKKRLRPRPWLLLVLALLLAGGVFALPQAITLSLGQQKLREYAELSLSQALGRKVTVGGEARLTSLPWMSLRVADLTVDDAPGFGPEPFLSVGLVSVDIRILPLFTRTIMPGAVTLDNPTLRLKRDASDRGNWEDLPFFALHPPHEAALGAPENGGGPQREDAPPGWNVAPVPSGIRIQDATVHFEDRRRGWSGALRHFTLATGRGERFEFHLSFDVTGLDPAVEAHFTAKGTAGFDPDRKSLTLEGAALESTLSVPVSDRQTPSPGIEPWTATLGAQVDFDSATGRLAVRDVAASSDDARMDGRLEVQNLMTRPEITAALSLRAAMDGPLSRLAGAPPSGDPDDPLPPRRPTEPGDKIHSFLDFSSRLLRGEKKPLREDLALDLELAAGPDAVTVTDLRLRLHAATITARGEYLAGERPRLRAEISADGLDLDRLPWSSHGSGWALPLPFLKQTGGVVLCNAHNLTAGGVPIADAHATAAMENGQIRLFPVSALIPGGTLSADLRGEVRGQALDLTAEAEISDTAPGHNGSGKKDDGNAPRVSRLILNGTLEDKGITGNLALNSPDPLAAARALGLAVKHDAAGQGPLESSIRTAFTLVPDPQRPWGRLELKGLHARIGPGEIDGGLTVSNAPVPAVNLDLRLAALDEKILAAFSGLAGPPGDDRPRPPRLDLDGRIAVDKAVLYGVEAKNISIAGTATQDKIEAGSIGADLFGGKLTGRAELTLGEQTNRLSVNASLAGADAAAMTDKLLAGPCTVTATAEGEGKTLADLLNALKGRIEAEMNKDPKAHKAGEAAFSKLKADIGFKGRAPRPENGAADSARAFDLTSTVALSGPGTLREAKADVQTVAAFGQDGVQFGQGKLSGTASLLVPGEKAGRNLPVTFAAGFSADLAKGAFAARNLTLETAGAKGGGKIEKKGRDEGGKLTGSFDFPDINPRELMPALGMAPPPHAANGDLRHGRLSFQIAEAASGIELKDISLNLDDTRVTGLVLLRSGLGRPKIDLDITHLDCDRYFPPKTGEVKPKDAGQDEPLDLARMREYDVEARVRFGLLKKGNITWKHGQTELTAKGGVFSMRHEASDFYGGRFHAEIKGDARDVVLKTSVDLQIDGFDGATFLKEWAEGDVLASGGTTFVLAIKSNGLTERALRRNTSGSARFQVTRGALKIRDSGSPPPSPQEPAATATPSAAPPAKAAEPKYDLLPFTVLSASYTAREGVAYTNDFLIDGKDMKVNGSGSVDLRDESIDLSVVATLDSGNKVPATVKGPLEDPKLEIDRNKLVGDMVYRVLKGIITLPAKALGKILFIE